MLFGDLLSSIGFTYKRLVAFPLQPPKFRTNPDISLEWINNQLQPVRCQPFGDEWSRVDELLLWGVNEHVAPKEKKEQQIRAAIFVRHRFVGIYDLRSKLSSTKMVEEIDELQRWVAKIRINHVTISCTFWKRRI